MSLILHLIAHALNISEINAFQSLSNKNHKVFINQNLFTNKPTKYRGLLFLSLLCWAKKNLMDMWNDTCRCDCNV